MLKYRHISTWETKARQEDLHRRSLESYDIVAWDAYIQVPNSERFSEM